ncbi:hypothetical protein RUM44_012406 [Polyplax serrata]|uniref:Uncharacterized protein n=1 Tax=Polyplax serrata TaxID=468196 RepID=A0ABR1BF16_POLSC
MSVDQWKNAEEHPGFATKELDGGVLFPGGTGLNGKDFCRNGDTTEQNRTRNCQTCQTSRAVQKKRTHRHNSNWSLGSGLGQRQRFTWPAGRDTKPAICCDSTESIFNGNGRIESTRRQFVLSETRAH